MIASAWLTRRGVVASGAALVVAGCGRKREAAPAATPAPAPAPGATGAARGTLDWAIAGDWRGQDAQRDASRHPKETLSFFGLRPGMTVVEVWPGAGWYTQILAPFLKETGGKLYAASFQAAETDESAAAQVVRAYRTLFGSRPALYGSIEFGSFGPTSPPLAPAGAADLVLFMNVLHSWMAGGLAERAFQQAFAALKPGGALGVESPRADPGGPQDPLAANGYVQEAYVKQLAAEAGFRFDAASEINANPKDNPSDRPPAAPASSDTIGDSDRMTLRFLKPG